MIFTASRYEAGLHYVDFGIKDNLGNEIKLFGKGFTNEEIANAVFSTLMEVAKNMNEKLKVGTVTLKRSKLTKEQANRWKAEIIKLESDPMVSKRELRLFMQSLMPCGHSVGDLLTCSTPPSGCVICNSE